jgi:hypothetical protein
MLDDKEKLWQSTTRSFERVSHNTEWLRDIANRVEYLHSNLSADLRHIAEAIDRAADTIRGNRAEEINMDIADMQKSSGELLVALLRG